MPHETHYHAFRCNVCGVGYDTYTQAENCEDKQCSNVEVNLGEIDMKAPLKDARAMWELPGSQTLLKYNGGGRAVLTRSREWAVGDVYLLFDSAEHSPALVKIAGVNKHKHDITPRLIGVYGPVAYTGMNMVFVPMTEEDVQTLVGALFWKPMKERITPVKTESGRMKAIRRVE